MRDSSHTPVLWQEAGLVLKATEQQAQKDRQGETVSTHPGGPELLGGFRRRSWQLGSLLIYAEPSGVHWTSRICSVKLLKRNVLSLILFLTVQAPKAEESCEEWTQRDKNTMSLSLERLDQGSIKIITLTIITANIYCLVTMWQALYCLPFRSNLFTLHHKTLRSALLLWTFAIEQQASRG